MPTITADNGKKSRRPFGTSSRSTPEQPDDLVFFVDRSLGRKRFPQPLRQAGLRVEIHDDHFPPDVEDEVWLSRIGERGWVAITKDERIRYRAIEREALVQSGVRTFILSGRNLPGPDLAEIFLRALPRVRRVLRKTGGPFIARINRSSKVTVVFYEKQQR